MTPEQWQSLGYRRFEQNDRYIICLWQRKIWNPPGLNETRSFGYLTWSEYHWPDGRVSYQVEGDIDDSDGPFGLRRMIWCPRNLTPDLVRLVEQDYKQICGVKNES